jgi:hypothetical protein
METTLKDRLWGDDPDPVDVQGADILFAANTLNFAACRLAGVPAICSFRPPEMSPFTNMDENTVVHLEFHLDATLYHNVKSFVNEQMQLDFGAYFDFTIPNTQFNLQHEYGLGAYDNKMLPNYPEDTPDIFWGKKNFRRRQYLTKEVHYLYNMKILEVEDVIAGGILSFLADDWTRWDRNQVVFWATHGRAAERAYLDPIRRIMLKRAGIDTRRLHLNDANRPKAVEAASSAEYIAWLHQPLMRSMHAQRSRITSRQIRGFATREDRRNDIDLRNDRTNVDNATSWKDALVGQLSTPEEFVVQLREELINRTEASIWSFHNIFPDHWRDLFSRLKGGPVSDEDQAAADASDNSDEDEDDLEYREFPAPSAFAYHWSSIQSKVKIPSIKDRLRFMRILRGNAIPNDQEVTIVSKAEMEQTFFLGPNALGPIAVAPNEDASWVPIGDTMNKILDSGLVVGGQIGGIQSFIGTRAHFRISIVLSGGKIVPAVLDAEGGGRPILDPRVFFPALGSRVANAEAPVQAFARQDWRIPENLNDMRNADLRSIALPVYEFMEAEQEPSLGAMDYTEILIMEMANGFVNFKRLINDTLAELAEFQNNGQPPALPPAFEATDFSIVGVEIPVFNPFCMYEGENSKYKFLTTQADFVALVVDKNTRQSKVVMGEFKTLIEQNNPVDRLLTVRTIKQTLSNATLYEMQTGVEVDFIMQIFVSRRTTPRACYFSCASIDRLRAAPLSKNALVRVQKNITLDARVKKKGFMCFDGARFGVFTTGYPYGTDVNVLPRLRPWTIIDKQGARSPGSNNEELKNNIRFGSPPLNTTWFVQNPQVLRKQSGWTNWRVSPGITRRTVNVKTDFRSQMFVVLIKNNIETQASEAADARAIQRADAAAAAAPLLLLQRQADAARQAAADLAQQEADDARQAQEQLNAQQADALLAAFRQAFLEGEQAREAAEAAAALVAGDEARRVAEAANNAAALAQIDAQRQAIDREIDRARRIMEVQNANAFIGAPPAPLVSTFRVPPPMGFGLGNRHYPLDEPLANVNARNALNNAVFAAANQILAPPSAAAPRFNNVVLNGQNAGFTWYKQKLKSIAQFFPVEPVHLAAPNANSGPRMLNAMMNPQPTLADFQAGRAAVIRQLVVRALHRYVDDFVVRAIDLLNPANANTADNFDKIMLSRRFMHNSQRAYWADTALGWARVQVLPVAVNMVTVAIT